MKTFFLLIILALPLSVHAFLNPPKFISLIPPDQNLENENLIEQLCPKSLANFQKCRKEKLAPKTWTLNVYEKPDLSFKSIGEIQIIGTPGRGLKAQYIPQGKPAIDFPSDSKGTDWGYSCYFEFTVSDIKGEWVQLPKRPFSNPIWINIKKDWPKKNDLEIQPTPGSVETDRVYGAGALGNIVFTRFSGNEFSFRQENENDMACGEELQQISKLKLKESTKPVSNLLDKDGHLIVWPAYCRGC